MLFVSVSESLGIEPRPLQKYVARRRRDSGEAKGEQTAFDLGGEHGRADVAYEPCRLTARRHEGLRDR